mgnify:CR=1 FL=1
MKNFKVDDNLIKAVKDKLSEDPLKYSHTVSQKRRWIPKLHVILHEFIDKSLNEFDASLAKNYEQIDSKSGYYFDEKTLRRGVSGEQSANADLINVLGYYAYGEDWKVKREKMFPLSGDATGNDDTRQIPKKYPASYILALLFGIGGIIAVLLLFQIRSCSTPIKPLTICECSIEQIPLESYQIDSIEYRRTSEAINWDDDSPLKNRIRQFAKKGLEGESTGVLEEETQKIIRELKSQFPDHDEIIIELQSFRTYYCVMDETICEAPHFDDKERFDRKEKNFQMYRNELSRIFSEKKAPEKKEEVTKPKKIKVVKKDDFSVSGINGNNSLLKSIQEVTGLVQTYSDNRKFQIKIEAAEAPIPKDSSQKLYYVPPCYLKVLINEAECCCFEETNYQLKGMPYIPGNKLNVVKNRMQEQINDLVEQHHIEIAQKIKACIDI